MNSIVVVYGPGGYDPEKPDNNVVESYEVSVPASAASVQDALAIAARLSAEARVRADDLPDEDVATLSLLWPAWTVDEAVEVGDLRAWDGTIVECIQAHTTQADWTPGATPALWKVHRTTSGANPDAWVQPTGGHDAYQTGDEVTHPDRANTMSQGSTTVWLWRSKINANTTEPGQDGTFHRWWEPVRIA